MDTSQWHQGNGLVNYIEGSDGPPNNTSTKPLADIRREKPQKDQVLNCPRCNSTNTKFCYYNNYSLTQPRYFCKTCRRYWTEGGTLRNIPVGGVSRKNKKAASSSSSKIDSSKVLDHMINNPPNLSQFSSQNHKTLEGQDLNLSFQATQDYHDHGITQFVEMPRIASSRVLNSYIPMPVPDSNMLYSSGFPLHELKPTLSFSVEGLGNGGFGNFHGIQGNGNGRVLFPFGELKQHPSTTDQVDHNKGQENPTPGYWNGMLGGGTW